MVTQRLDKVKYSPYLTMSREEWRKLRHNTPLTLSESDLVQLKGINENLSMDEVIDIYLPLSRLLHLYISATKDLHQATNTFLGKPTAKVPFIIGIAGSVAVGKSTTARVLQALLARSPQGPKVELVTTDGFLYPNAELERRGLMQRKGFPESYDVQKLIRCIADVKSGRPEVAAPVYSHTSYDILRDEEQVIRQPDILIVEGLNVLQVGETKKQRKVFVSDFFDFSIYVDAGKPDLQKWYIERFKTLCRTAFTREDSYFHRFAALTEAEAIETAVRIWKEINEANLDQNIVPTRERAQLILTKGQDHFVHQIKLRKL